MDIHQNEQPTRSIVWLAGGNERGGAQSAIINLAIALRSAGHRTVIVACDEGPLTEAARRVQLDVLVASLGVPPNLSGEGAEKLLSLYRVRRFRKRAAPLIAALLRNRGFNEELDVFQTTTPELLSLAVDVSMRLNVRCVWEMTNAVSDTPFDLARRYFRSWCRLGNVVVLANSQYTADSIHGGGVEPRVMHLGVDPERFDPMRAGASDRRVYDRSKLGIAIDAPVVGMVARLVESKNQLAVIEAMASLGDRARELHLVLVGGPLDSPYGRAIESMRSRLGLVDRVHVIGPSDEPERWLSMCDVAISVYRGAETFGISAVEAMMSGRAVLVHVRGGPGETVIDGQTGWHIARADVPGIAEGIVRMLDDRSKWKSMGAASRMHAVRLFSLAQQRATYERLVFG
jgi:glycosyltransferase involved in cell wall biosynthesis